MTDLSVELPARPGPRPRTTPTNPHTQLDQQPHDGTPRSRLRQALDRLPGVTWRPSGISVPGALALCNDGPRRGPAESFMIGGEFAHLHPAPDHSLHLMVPASLAQQLIDLGWAEPHPVVRMGLLPPTAVMVYAPRDDGEADLVARIVAASHSFATGHAPGDAPAA